MSTRSRALVSLLVVVTLGLVTVVYRGPGWGWTRYSLGGVFYVLAWCFFAASLCPRCAPARIALGVLAATCTVEMLQLWHPAWLETIRATTPGRLLLGTSFFWSDFPYYFVGSGVAWWWMRKGRPEAG